MYKTVPLNIHQLNVKQRVDVDFPTLNNEDLLLITRCLLPVEVESFDHEGLLFDFLGKSGNALWNYMCDSLLLPTGINSRAMELYTTFNCQAQHHEYKYVFFSSKDLSVVYRSSEMYLDRHYCMGQARRNIPKVSDLEGCLLMTVESYPDIDALFTSQGSMRFKVKRN